MVVAGVIDGRIRKIIFWETYFWDIFVDSSC